jgi:thiosulfate/3-mercaptopyruvate sulfurtransferase
MSGGWPRVIEPAALAERLGGDDQQIVFVGDEARYAQAHIAGATCIPYQDLIASRPPAGGVLPDAGHLAPVLGEAGIRPGVQVIAYDASGNGAASRLLWTLDCLGHTEWSLLDGGLPAWLDEGQAVVTGAGDARIDGPPYPVGQTGGTARADADYIEAHLDSPDVVVLDARSPGEYRGEVPRAARSGHIPGAVNREWTDDVDPQRHGRLRPAHILAGEYAALGVTPDREVITHCQTHHRSALTYVVLRWLGFDRVRGYDGSWSEWGNDPARPVTGPSAG